MENDLLIQTDLTVDPENPDKVTLWLDVTQVMGPRDHDGDIPLDMIEQYPVLSMPREIWNKMVAIAAGGGEGELEFAAASLIESIQLELYSIDQDEGRIHPDVPIEGISAMELEDE